MLRPLRRVPAVALLLLPLAAACGGSLQGPPEFVQAYGTVDRPCGVGATGAATHCTAHVLLVNHGGEGIGHATIVVPLRDSSAATSARTASAATCGRSIPDTAGGGGVDLTCDFDLPAGKTVASVPILQAVDFSAAAAGGSSSAGGGMGTFALALVAAVLALVTLGAAAAGRLAPSSSRPERGSSAVEGQEAGESPDDRRDDDGTW